MFWISCIELLLNILYFREVNVAQEDLNEFLTIAEDLKVKGLTQGGSASDNKTGTKRPSSPEIKHTKRPRPPDPVRPVKPAAVMTPATVATVDDDIQEVTPVKTEPGHDNEAGVSGGDQHVGNQGYCSALWEIRCMPVHYGKSRYTSAL